MSRPVVLLFGALLWGTFAIVALAHIAFGNPLVPFAAVLIVATGVTVYHAWPRELTTAPSEVEARD